MPYRYTGPHNLPQVTQTCGRVVSLPTKVGIASIVGATFVVTQMCPITSGTCLTKRGTCATVWLQRDMHVAIMRNHFLACGMGILSCTLFGEKEVVGKGFVLVSV